MGFFEDSMENAKAAFGIAQKKTEKAVEISKKKVYEKKLQNRLEALYTSLGERYYRCAKNGSADDFSDIINSIDALRAELKNVADEINSMKSQEICPNCGYGVKKDMSFCPKCGNKI